jgi:acyl dehydratase
LVGAGQSERPFDTMTPVGAVPVAGPYFEELAIGDALTAPAMTLTDGHRAVHQAILGDRFAVYLDSRLAARVFRGRSPVTPGLVIDTAIGQSSVFTRRVRANLFYRGLQLHRLPEVGDTLTTTTEIVGLKQNRLRADRPATGLAVLRVHATDQNDQLVLDFERCAMLPLKDQTLDTGHRAETLGSAELDMNAVATLAAGWDLNALRSSVPGPRGAELQLGMAFQVEEADAVTGALELARLTLNLAIVHHDGRATDTGERLVYGGHTIGLAAHQAAKALPGICAIVAWHGCDHTGPVFEEDLLTSEIVVEGLRPLHAGGVLADLRSVVSAHRGDQSSPVLDWRFIAVVA